MSADPPAPHDPPATVRDSVFAPTIRPPEETGVTQVRPASLPAAGATVLADAHAPRPAAASGPAGIGPYEILRELGRGGMGVVYLARHRELDRTVALKVLNARGDDPELIQRFQREARAAARLNHPGIVPIHDVGCEGDLHYFSMEYILGETVAGLAGRARPSPRRALEMVVQVARALACAHAEGIIHRDLKPQNLLVSVDGRVRIADFGLAKDLSRDSVLTQEGMLMGTPSYMSPEQAQGKHQAIDARTDIYSLGAVLYYLLAGRPPFEGTTAQVVHAVVHQIPVPVRRVASDVSVDIETLCMKCLESEPDRRYASAAALAEDGDRFLEGLPLNARPPSLLGRVARTVRRRPALAASAAIATAAACLSLFWVQWTTLEQEERLQAETRRIENANRRFHSLTIEVQACDSEPVASTAARLARIRDDLTPLLEIPTVERGARLTFAALSQWLGDYPAVGESVTKLLERWPEHPSVLYRAQMLGDALVEEGLAGRYPEWVEAGRKATAAFALRPDLGFARASRVRALLGVGDGPAALALARALLAEQEARPEVVSLLLHAELLAGLPDPGEPEELSRRIVQEDPRSHRAWGMRGELLLRLGRVADAMDALRTCLALQPKPSAGTFRRIGRALEARLRLRGADACADAAKICDAHPDRAAAWLCLAQLQRAAGRADAAAAALARAQALAPDDPVTVAEELEEAQKPDDLPRAIERASAQLGALVAGPMRAGLAEEPAVRLMDALIARGAAASVEGTWQGKGQTPLANLAEGRARLARGAVAEALPLLEAAAQGRGGDPAAWTALGTARARAGRLPEAAEAFVKSASVEPAEPAPHLALALLHLRAGRDDEAARELAEAARRLSPVRLIERRAAWAAGEFSEEPGAAVSAENPVRDGARLVGIAPAAARVLVEIGARELAAGRSDGAEAAFEAAGALAPDAPEPWLGLARVQARAGRSLSAALCLRRAVRHGAKAEEIQRDADLRALRPLLEALPEEPR